jgi:hypothetical protein
VRTSPFTPETRNAVLTAPVEAFTAAIRLRFAPPTVPKPPPR